MRNFRAQHEGAGVDLTKIDLRDFCNRHSDHATGVKYLLKVNPAVTIYVPADGRTDWRDAVRRLFPPDADLPGKSGTSGTAPEHLNSGSCTTGICVVKDLTEVAPEFCGEVSQKKGRWNCRVTLGDNGQRIAACGWLSHAGIEAILEAASAIDRGTEIVFGGLHLVTTPVRDLIAGWGIADEVKCRDRSGTLHG